MNNASGADDVTEHDGASDLVTFEVTGKPTPRFRIETIGRDPDIRYRYAWADRGTPTPEQFERVGHLEVKLVGMMPDLEPGAVRQAADDAHQALVDLKTALMDARDLGRDQRQELALGNLDGLPEVEKIGRRHRTGGDADE